MREVTMRTCARSVLDLYSCNAGSVKPGSFLAPFDASGGPSGPNSIARVRVPRFLVSMEPPRGCVPSSSDNTGNALEMT